MSLTITAITMPKWGLTMTEGKVLGWLKHEGDAVRRATRLLEIETTKITNVMEAGETGTLAPHRRAEGATLPIGALLAVVAPAGRGRRRDRRVRRRLCGARGRRTTTRRKAEARRRATSRPPAMTPALSRTRRAATAPPVVFIHGFGADLNTWMFTQPALAERHRTIALDLPGHGGSTKDVGAGDVADAGRRGRPTRSPRSASSGSHLVGHSMGGAIALRIAPPAARAAWRALTLIASAGLGREINAAFIDGFVRWRAGARRRTCCACWSTTRRWSAATMVEDVLRYKRLDGVAAALRDDRRRMVSRTAAQRRTCTATAQRRWRHRCK